MTMSGLSKHDLVYSLHLLWFAGKYSRNLVSFFASRFAFCCFFCLSFAWTAISIFNKLEAIFVCVADHKKGLLQMVADKREAFHFKKSLILNFDYKLRKLIKIK